MLRPDAKESKPDFSRPRTAAATALKNLEKANKKHDDRAAVEAALQLVVAVERLGDDRQAIKGPNPGGQLNINALPDLLQTQIDLAKTADARSLLYLLKAYAYPELPGLPYDSVRKNVEHCYTEAINQLGSDNYPLDKWRNVIEISQKSLQVFPTVRDFIATVPVAATYIDENQTLKFVNEAQEHASPQSYTWFYWQMERLKAEHSPDEGAYVESLDLLFDKYADIEPAQLVLERFAELSGRMDKYKNIEWAKRVRSFAARFPASPCRENILASVSIAARPAIIVSAQSRVAVGQPVKITLNAYGTMQTAGVEVVHNGVAGKVLKANVNQSEFQTGSYELEFTPKNAGNYVLRPFFDNTRPQRYASIGLFATTVSPSMVNADGTRAVIVSASTDGAPLGGMKIYAFVPDGQANEVEYIGTTGSDGVLMIGTPPALAKKQQRSSRYKSVQFAVVGNNVKASELTPAGLQKICNREDYRLRYSRREDADAPSTEIQAVALTDRALYRPGDKLQWMAVAAQVGREEGSPAKQLTLSVELTDTDGTVIAETEVKTDDWGRATGEFTLPAKLKPGYCRINIQQGFRQLASASAAVSDFKLPAVKVQIDSIYTAKQTVVKGHVTTYTGVPVAEAKILVNTDRVQWWMFDFKTMKVAAEGLTDARGYFEITLPNEDADDDRDRLRCIDVTAVSPQAETGSAYRFYFSPRPYTIAQTESELDISMPVQLPVRVVDGQGREVEIPLEWTLETADGKYCGLNGSLDWSSLPGGKYKLKVSPVDSTLAFSQVMNIKLYDVQSGKMPADQAIFLPKRSFKAPAGSTLTIKYGVPEASNVAEIRLVNQISGQPLITVSNKSVEAGFHDMTVELPDKPGRMQLALRTVHNGCIETDDIGIEVEKNNVAAMEIVSFRDRLQPGAREHWTLKFKADGKDKSFAACVLAYNSALSALDAYRLPGLGYMQRLFADEAWLSVNSTYCTSNRTTLSAKVDKPEDAWYTVPCFNYLPQYAVHSYLAMPMMASNQMMRSTNFKAGVMTEDRLSEEYEAAGGSQVPASAAAELMKQYDFRPAEQLQAIWQPTLHSDGNGNLSIEFDAPQTNGAWTLHALGWNRRMKSASLTREFVTSRPLMVHSVLPRFLRQGDEATVQATVSSAMEREASADVVFEIFDPVGNQVLQRVSRSVNLKPDSSATVSATVTAPLDAQRIACRVLAVSGRFTDGEQDEIPVLSSGITVRDAEFRFYPEGIDPRSIKVPQIPGVRTWMEFSDKPVDNIVKIINAVQTPEPHTATEAAAQLYYARVKEEVTGAADSTLKAIRQRALEVLADCHRKEGGWAWGGWAERPSEWVSGRVLRDLAGTSDSRVDSMAMKALPFLQTCALADHDFAPGPNFDFTEICALYPRFTPSELGRRLIDLTIKYIEKNWRKFDLAQLPRVALMLQRYGREQTARQVLQSIGEYTVTEPDGLVWIPKIKHVDAYAQLIEAYNRLAPDAPQLRGMQAWLIRRTVATENFSACNPVRLIEALLPLVRESRSMAWSAVYSEADRRADDVKPSDSDRVAVSRRLMVRDAEGLHPADSFELGQQVEMELTVRTTDDLDFVELTDMLPAGLQPAEQLGKYTYQNGLWYYFAPEASSVKFYISSLPRGTHRLSYRLTAATAGRFATGVAVAESVKDPSATAHSGGSTLIIKQ